MVWKVWENPLVVSAMRQRYRSGTPRLTLCAYIAALLGVGALINYILNYHFTFQSNKGHTEALAKFLIVAIFGAGINATIMYKGVENTDMNYLIVQVFATSVVLLWNFAVNKLWTFTHPATNQY